MCNQYGSIGIDKLKLKGINIRIVDLSKLYGKAGVSISQSELYRREFHTNEGIRSFGSIVIHDCIFKLIIGVKKFDTYRFTNYEVIELNPAAILFGLNIRNVNEAVQLEEVIRIVNERLQWYGIEADIRQAAIEELEINTNIQLDGDFDKYRNAFELIRSVLPKAYKTSGSFEDRELGKYTGFKASNQQISLKFYDKLTEKGVVSDYSVLRVEYKLLSREKVERLFNYSCLNDLINNFTDKDRVFSELVQKDIVDKVSRRIRQLVSLNAAILMQAKSDEKCYVRHYLAITQDDLIFDYRIAAAAIAQLDVNKSTKSKRRQELREGLITREQNGTNKFFGNIEKLSEVFVKLGFEILYI